MEGEDIGSGGWLALRLGHLESLSLGPWKPLQACSSPCAPVVT